MKKFILALIVITILAVDSSAMAADNWTGFYVGVGGGYGGWSADTKTVNPTTGTYVLAEKQTQGGQGFLGTFGIGFDYEFYNKIVVGVLVDYHLSNLEGTIQDQGPFAAGDIKEKQALAAGARIGWLFSPNTLVYVNGGWSRAYFSDAEMSRTFNGTPLGYKMESFNTDGWFAGLGMETNLAYGFSLKLEYRYADYGSEIVKSSPPIANYIEFEPTVHTGTIQLVYKFW